MSIAAALLARERRLVERFRSAGATSPTAARPPAELGAEDARSLERLQQRAVLREAKPGVYYLDEPSWHALRRTRQRIVGLVLLVAAALAVVFFLTRP